VNRIDIEARGIGRDGERTALRFDMHTHFSS
jgi:hypothetical protein